MKKWLPLSLHLLAWTLFLLTTTIDVYQADKEYINKSVADSGLNKLLFVIIFNLCYTTVSLVAFYGAYLLIGPYLFIRKQYFKATSLLFFVFTTIVVTRYIIEFHVLLPFLKFDNYPSYTVTPKYYITNCILFTYKYCLLGLIAYFISSSRRIEKEKEEIAKQKIRAELSFLKSQINPHFLFNTINDIYALTYKQSDQAPTALLKLSSILRYMLHDGATENVLLEKELSYIKDFIELQRMGLKDQLYLDFDVQGNVQQVRIVPLLLIPFIENIFKHGVVDDPAAPAKVKITVSNHDFIMSCSNKVREKHKDSVSGIGLNNVRRRLELLYPNKHNFILDSNANYFDCSLKIALQRPNKLI